VPVAVQQPFGHEVASHTQCPLPLHSCPLGQAVQASPPAPHEVLDSLDRASHVLLLQQPGQVVPPHVHAPWEHVLPVVHVPHAAPPLPHSEADWALYGTHVSPLQQPAGHEVALHTQAPLLRSHTWVARHAPQADPFEPQTLLDCEEYGSHCPDCVQQPWGQLEGPQPLVPTSLPGPSWALSVAVESEPGPPSLPPSPLLVVPSAPPSQSTPPEHSPFENAVRPSIDAHAATVTPDRSRAATAMKPRTHVRIRGRAQPYQHEADSAPAARVVDGGP
jgi:hypothetical protein